MKWVCINEKRSLATPTRIRLAVLDEKRIYLISANIKIDNFYSHLNISIWQRQIDWYINVTCLIELLHWNILFQCCNNVINFAKNIFPSLLPLKWDGLTKTLLYHINTWHKPHTIGLFLFYLKHNDTKHKFLLCLFVSNVHCRIGILFRHSEYHLINHSSTHSSENWAHPVNLRE